MQECPVLCKVERQQADFLRKLRGVGLFRSWVSTDENFSMRQWRIHTTCLWCDKELRFFRALTGSRYCCNKHLTEDRAHIKQLVIERFEIYVSQKHAKQKMPDTLLLPLEPSPVSTIKLLQSGMNDGWTW